MLRERLVKSALERIAREQGALDELAGRIARKETDPYALAEDVAARLR